MGPGEGGPGLTLMEAESSQVPGSHVQWRLWPQEDALLLQPPSGCASIEQAVTPGGRERGLDLSVPQGPSSSPQGYAGQRVRICESSNNRQNLPAVPPRREEGDG